MKFIVTNLQDTCYDMFFLRLIACCFCLIFLDSCGFQPKGAYQLPVELKNIYVEGGSPVIREELRDQIKQSKGQLVDLRENAGVVIRLFDEQFQRRGLSLSERGKTNEYELLYKVDYEVDAPNDTVLLARQPLEIRKDYYNDQQAILARDNEEATLRTEMLRQAVRALLNQARFTYKK